MKLITLLLKPQLATLLAEKKEGKNQWIEAKQKYDDLLAEKTIYTPN
jgi:hypothetical protein